MASNITTLEEKAKQGDADAFSTLYQMYYPKMKGKCLLEDINRFAEANFGSSTLITNRSSTLPQGSCHIGYGE